METLSTVTSNFLNQLAVALPGIIGAIIIIIIGVVVGWFVGKVVTRVLNATVESHFDKSEIGRAFKNSGFNFSSFIGGVIYAFIVIVALTIALGLLAIPGPAGTFIVAVAAFLPRLLAGIIVIVLGIVLADFLTAFIGRILRPMFGRKVEIPDMLRNLLFLGLIAVILDIAFDLFDFSAASLVYSLILGFVVIGVGIILTDTLIKSVIEDHSEFSMTAGYAKFVLYAIFLLIGTGAIFSTFPGVTGIISTIAWGFAIAFAIALIPIVYTAYRRIRTEGQKE